MIDMVGTFFFRFIMALSLNPMLFMDAFEAQELFL